MNNLFIGVVYVVGIFLVIFFLIIYTIKYNDYEYCFDKCLNNTLELNKVDYDSSIFGDFKCLCNSNKLVIFE